MLRIRLYLLFVTCQSCENAQKPQIQFVQVTNAIVQTFIQVTTEILLM